METIPSVTLAEFETGDYVSRRQPCLISDGLAPCEGMRRWTPEYLAATCGDVRVKVSVSVDRGGRTPAAPRRQEGYSLPQVPLREAVRWITNAELADRQFYVPNEPIQRFRPLCQDIRFPKPTLESKTRIWFGTADTVSGLHHDYLTNWYAQVFGEKQFILFSPDQVNSLYPKSGSLAHWSAVDPVHPDLDAFPRFAAARPVTVTVTAGEVLFLPSFWWHHVTSLSVSISVNQWWRDDLSEYCNKTGARLMTANYKSDKLAGELHSRNLQLEDLLVFAETAAAMDQTMAALALCVVLDACDRWPDRAQVTAPVEADVRQGVERLRQAVLDETVYEIAPETIVALARRIRHASVLAAFAHACRQASLPSQAAV